MVYASGENEVQERIGECFMEAYPDIEYEYVRGTTGEMMPRIEQERQSGSDGGDVWIGTDPGWFAEASDSGDLLTPSGPALEEWPEGFLRDNVVVGGLESLAIAYNTDLVESPPEGYSDLLDPEFTGSIGTTEVAARILVGWYSWLEETEGPDFLEELANQKPLLYVGSVGVTAAVAAGEVKATMYALPTGVSPLAEQGAPIEYVVPSPSFGVEYLMGAFAWSKRPNAALVFQDFLMSRDGQACWHGTGDSASPLPDIEGALDISTIEPWDYETTTDEVEADINQRFNELFVG